MCVCVFSLLSSIILKPHWVPGADIVLVDRTVLHSAYLHTILELPCPAHEGYQDLAIQRWGCFSILISEMLKTSSCFPYAPDYTGSKLHVQVIYFLL